MSTQTVHSVHRLLDYCTVVRRKLTNILPFHSHRYRSYPFLSALSFFYPRTVSDNTATAHRSRALFYLALVPLLHTSNFTSISFFAFCAEGSVTTSNCHCTTLHPSTMRGFEREVSAGGGASERHHMTLGTKRFRVVVPGLAWFWASEVLPRVTTWRISGKAQARSFLALAAIPTESNTG